MFDSAAYFRELYRHCIRGLSDLHDYQLEAVDWLEERPFSALFIDTGMGKTVIIDTLIDRLLTRGYQGKILIIAPIRVATRVWMREHRLWHHIAHFNPELLRIDDDDPRVKAASVIDRVIRKRQLRTEAIQSPKQIHVINQEAVSWLVDQYVKVTAKKKVTAIKRWPYPVVIFDESSRLRDHNSEVFTALKRVELLNGIKRFHQLTATPASQTYMHLFSQMWLLDRGERLGTHITHFREKYFSQNIYNRTWAIRDGAAEEIERKIADICLVMRRKRNTVIHTRQIHLPEFVMREYLDFERDSILQISPEKVIDAVNGAVLSNKLLQFASGAVYDSDRQYHIVHDEKIEELRQLVDETLDNPVLVAYWFKSSLARLRKAFPKAAVMDREGKIEEQWNKGKLKLLFVHPRSVAHGLNLQFGGHHIVLFDIFWPLELFTQLIDRLDRPGQLHTVMVHLLSAVGTHDEVVSANLELLRNAEAAMFRRLEALRRNQRKREYASQSDPL